MALRALIATVLAGAMSSCGIDDRGDKTCVQTLVKYAGSRSGPAYLRMTTSDHSLFIATNDASIDSLVQSAPHVDTCWSGGAASDIPVTAVVWIDVSPTGNPSCASVQDDPLCQPASGDPQGRQSAVLHNGQFNVVQVEVVDPP